MEYIRNGVRELVNVLGQERALELAKLAARLTGLQQYRHMAEAVGGVDGGPAEAARFLTGMLRGMGDDVEIAPAPDQGRAVLHQRGLRIARGLEGEERDHLLACWTELWRGAVHSCRTFMDVAVTETADGLDWTITPKGAA